MYIAMATMQWGLQYLINLGIDPINSLLGLKCSLHTYMLAVMYSY